MPLVTGTVATDLYNFIQEANSAEIENKDEAIMKFCVKIEELIYSSIRNATLTIPPGSIIVTQPPTVVGAVNPAPVVIFKGGLS